MRFSTIANIKMVPDSGGLLTNGTLPGELIKPYPSNQTFPTLLPDELIKPGATGEPVPGQTYNAYVKNRAGDSLKAGWLYLDKDGLAITTDFFADGEFHFTVPDFNYQYIFVHIYSTEEYEPVVKTFKQLVDNPTVILELKTKGGMSTEATLSLLGLGVAVLALSRQKKGIGATYLERYKSQSTGKKLLIVAGIGGALYLIFKYKPTKEQKDYIDAAKSMLDHLSADYGIVPSLTNGQFSSMVTTIVRALDKCGSDEDSIYRMFEMLNNEADLYKLIVSYGIAKYDGCFEGSLPYWTVHYTLGESLQSDLSSSEVQRINSILGTKGISFSF